jgi:hypothetical protein
MHSRKLVEYGRLFSWFMYSLFHLGFLAHILLSFPALAEKKSWIITFEFWAQLPTDENPSRNQKYDPKSLNKIWGFHGRDCEECRLLGYKIPGHTSQETHYVSATDPSQLMLCKIWGFHGGNYEECRLLGYKIQAHTSQETHYVSTTEPSRLMLRKIWGFHGGDYEKVVFWDIKSKFVLHRRHIISPLQSPAV